MTGHYWDFILVYWKNAVCRSTLMSPRYVCVGHANRMSSQNMRKHASRAPAFIHICLRIHTHIYTFALALALALALGGMLEVGGIWDIFRVIFGGPKSNID